MGFYDVSLMSTDGEFLGRTAACYAVETRAAQEDPTSWSQQNRWQMASTPGFGDAYASARAAGNEHPGSDPAVITDEQILSSVQYLMNPPPPEDDGAA